VPDDVDDLLLAAGFMVQNESLETMNDIYFDTKEFHLLKMVSRVTINTTLMARYVLKALE
jgi:hypothetical protein